MSAVKKFMKTSKKRKVIDIIIIRINKSGVLRNSRPCVKCLELLHNNPCFIIKNVYYSNESGEIEKVKFNKLLNSRKHYSKRFRN